ncbi:MAG: hypothetical protein HOP00_01550 [Nitrospira sp.]|nr:hypothetical protein [Nitrospira sp.]
MALGLKRHAAKQQTEQETILPIAENAEYRAMGLKIQELERLQSEKLVRRKALQNQRWQLRSSSFVDFLTTKFLSGDSEPSEASLIEKIDLNNDEIRALGKAIQLATQEQGNLRNRLSGQIRETHHAAYRQHLRHVLAGMLLIQSANDAVMNLRESLERGGYAAGTFVPAGLCLWPYWGTVTDPSSLWQMHLRDLLDQKVIDRSEFESFSEGDLLSFKP